MFHRGLRVVLACGLGLVAVAALDAAAQGRLPRHHRVCQYQAQAAAKAPATAANVPAEVEQVLKQLRSRYPGKTDEQIIHVLRGYVSHDSSTEKDAVRWLAQRLQQAERERALATEIENRDGYVIWSESIAPQWLQNLLGEGVVTSIRFLHVSDGADDDCLSRLKGLSQLQDLSLNGARKITDAGLEHLKGLTRLRELGIHGCPINEDGEKKLRQLLPKCKVI